MGEPEVDQGNQEIVKENKRKGIFGVCVGEIGIVFGY